MIEALDKDVDADDLLGSSNPLSFNQLTQDTELMQHELEIYDENYKHSGFVKFQT